jgi:hypothetical protein
MLFSKIAVNSAHYKEVGMGWEGKIMGSLTLNQMLLQEAITVL